MSRYRDAVEAGYDGPSPYEVARARQVSRYDKQDPREPDETTEEDDDE